MGELIKECPQYRVLYVEGAETLMWMDKVTEPSRHRCSRRTFPDFDCAKRDFSEAPEEWTDWIITGLHDR